MDIYQELENWQKNVLSLYCINVCGGHCCQIKNVKIRITKDQIKEILKVSEQKDLKIPAKRDWDNDNSFFINTYQNSDCPFCPAFNSGTKLCKIQHLKPKMCLEFPLIIIEEEIILHHRCLLSDTRGQEIEELKNICLKYNYSLYIE